MMTKRDMVIHCSATPNGRETDASDIHQWHKERKFDGIGYHYVINMSGDIQQGRPPYWTGAHCYGHNEKIGICLVGTDEFTHSQYAALDYLINTFGGKVYGHYELFAAKTCPNFDPNDNSTRKYYYAKEALNLDERNSDGDCG